MLKKAKKLLGLWMIKKGFELLDLDPKDAIAFVQSGKAIKWLAGKLGKK